LLRWIIKVHQQPQCLTEIIKSKLGVVQIRSRNSRQSLERFELSDRVTLFGSKSPDSLPSRQFFGSVDPAVLADVGEPGQRSSLFVAVANLRAELGCLFQTGQCLVASVQLQKPLTQPSKRLCQLSSHPEVAGHHHDLF